MGKRKIAVSIDCEDELCGQCEYGLTQYSGEPEGRCCHLFGVGKKTGKRCHECIENEIKVSLTTGPLMFAEGRISGMADACDIIRGCMEWTGVSEDDRNFARVLIERIMPTPIIAGD